MVLSPFASTLRKSLAAGAVVAALGIAMPAQAADAMQFGFTFGNGGSGFSFSLGNGGYIGRHFAPPPRPVCMTYEQVRNRLRDQGYRLIAFNGENRGWIHAKARKGGRAFQFDVNRCTGRVANVVALGGWGGGDFAGWLPPDDFRR